MIFSPFVSWQLEIEDLRKQYKSNLEETIILQLMRGKIHANAVECPETSNENEAIEVHHLNSITYLLNHSIEVLRFLLNGSMAFV